jgi:Flp pilus assembly pilin Flp
VTARLEPQPGITVPGVGVPAPTERQATDAAVEYGWLIAVVAVALIIKAAFTYVTRRIDFRLVLVLVGLGGLAYMYGKAQ